MTVAFSQFALFPLPAICATTRRVGDLRLEMDLGTPACSRCQAMTRVDPFQEIAAMGVVTNLRNAAIAVNVLEGARDACVNLKPMAMHMTDKELQQRAEVVAHVIRARDKLKLISQRADQLKSDLDRFKARRQAMNE